MADIHIIAQGKGGVGKTVVSLLLAQHLKQSENLLAIDLDPVNNSFSNFKRLKPEVHNIVIEGAIAPELFDGLMEILINTKQTVVIDTGASTFLPFIKYLDNQNVIELLNEYGHQVFLHSIIAGGHSHKDTVNDFVHLNDLFSNRANMCLWLNPFLGKIEYNGQQFIETDFFKDFTEEAYAIIHMPVLSLLFYSAIRDCLSSGRLFDDYVQAKDKSIMERQRVKLAHHQYEMILNQCFKQLKEEKGAA